MGKLRVSESVSGDTNRRRRTKIVDKPKSAIDMVSEAMYNAVGLPPDAYKRWQNGARYYDHAFDTPLIDHHHPHYNHHRFNVGQALGMEFEKRWKSEQNVYVVPSKRTFTAADEARAGKMIGELFRKHNYKLSCGQRAAAQCAMDAMRLAIMQTDGSLNVPHNAALIEEMNGRWAVARDTWEELLDDVRLGMESDPVGKIRKLKETQW